jgi:hypothetical protein
MNQAERERKIGATIGLVVGSCSKEHHRAEQVYVRKTLPFHDEGNTHPIELDAWVGYGSVGFFRITRDQASELVSLLSTALMKTEGKL